MLGGTLAATVCAGGPGSNPFPFDVPFDVPFAALFVLPFDVPSWVGPRPNMERPGCRGGGEDGVRPDESVKMPSQRYLLLEVLFRQDIQP
ncbi:hypothetical protein GCM10027063_01910 [Promicromonospora xylanilytica]